MRLVDPHLQLVAVGSSREPEAWARQVLGRTGGLIDYLSIHLYAASSHLYTGSDEYDAVVTQSRYFERSVLAYADLVQSLADELGVERQLSLAMDERNIRHLEPADWPEPERSDDGGFADRDISPTISGTGLKVNR
jgi:alpha-N-arabinofuranosidase